MRLLCSKFPLQLAVLSTALLVALAAWAAADSVRLAKTTVGGVPINLIWVDLNDPNVRVTPAIAQYGIGRHESFRSMMRRMRPAAAINGTFFCTRTFRPTGDIVIDNQMLAKGCVGTPLAVDNNNGVAFLPSTRGNSYRWWDYQHVVEAGPTLLSGGKTLLMPKEQGFKSRVHFTPAKRAAVGVTSENRLVFVTTGTKIYLRTLAKVMRLLKCTDAAALDGGSSIALYWKGKLVANPGRAMTNCLLVYDDLADYEQHRSCFYPALRYASATE